MRPRSPAGLRSWQGLWLLASMAAALYGLFLGLTGNGVVAMVLALAGQALLTVASNAKHAMLGEPLLFSDLALIGAVFRHPQFYLSAVRLWQRMLASLAAAVLVGTVVWLSHSAPGARLAGLAVMAGGLGVLALSLLLPPWKALARTPDAAADTRRHGLLPTILLYWRRWRAERDPVLCAEPARHTPTDPPELVVMIQCESFADPAELFADPARTLPGLEEARSRAMQWGNLEVSGFGAYTMRTEYGVLFGRDEAALGFRRYDPFLTALGEGSYALPARLEGWRSLFAHPHDMRFYGRHEIMPAGGFAELVGEERFAPPAPGEGRYVTDAAMADVILDLAVAARQPSLIYAVTIENHGPWAPDARGGGDPDLVEGYMRLVRHGDAMLSALAQRLAALGRPALLVFFGDHRPSIPGASVPGGARHTPYVMIRMDEQGRVVPGGNRRIDLTPAQLHHAVLDTVLGAQVFPGTP
ncbi:LTA synthase family protein [Novosphingobium beihaiensis]|uniref:LTA synthase family protein n=1 Tax=Novosphingobium beihaiensis TaxID=2930389 RepID=UPI002E116DE5